MITTPAPSRLNVSSCGITFGTMWPNRIRQVFTLHSRAATTKGWSRSRRVAALVTRAKAGMLKADSAQMTFSSL